MKGWWMGRRRGGRRGRGGFRTAKVSVRFGGLKGDWGRGV